MTGWLLEAIEIEGFRGINNEGDPLVLKFKADAVNSVSAPNGVGKSSIFDALTFALTGEIPKLDGLPATEKGESYYLNRFHTGGIGTIKLTLLPSAGGASVTITVTRSSDGIRHISAPTGVDGESLLASLNREFVLLDYKAFQNFIDTRALDRGRAFAGLLGLSRYSEIRQALQAISNTRAFNNHFKVVALEKNRKAAADRIANLKGALQSDFKALTNKEIDFTLDPSSAQAQAHQALSQIAVLSPHCSDRAFAELDFDDCIEAIRLAEGGNDRLRLSEVLREETDWVRALEGVASPDDFQPLAVLAAARDDALRHTSGEAFRSLYKASEEILTSESWPDKDVCPVCDHQSENSILEIVRAKLNPYDSIEAFTSEIASHWTTKNFRKLIHLEGLALREGEHSLIADADSQLRQRSLTAADVANLSGWSRTLHERAKEKLISLATDKAALESRLPDSLVAVTTAVETARRLQKDWKQLSEASAEINSILEEQQGTTRIKTFLDQATSLFAQAEAAASKRRLKAVEPLCQSLFASIMHVPVIPSLQKPDGSEELSLALSEFWGLESVSAQALLSESYRNAFAISVYLAAASLYGGAPQFLVLDDVTSSFDAGHQFHLMEVIRRSFARPSQPNGPQVILLSHDTLLEKLFNKYSQQPGWWHQRLEGTAHTAVLPQSGAANRLRDRALYFLNSGQVDDAAPRVRQYLEYKLLEVISSVQIPVPVDFAVDDTKKQVQSCIDAIDRAVDLHQRANYIVLDNAQISGLSLNIATISGNFLAHYATGSTGAFTASSLMGVMTAIDAYADCFRFEHPTGSGQRRYYRSLGRKL